MKIFAYSFIVLAALKISFSKAQTIGAGAHHSLAICEDGTVRGWGSSGIGQLGSGTNSMSGNNVQVSGLSDIVAVSADHYHSLFLKNDGTVWACGLNNYGQLGDSTTVDRNIPVQVKGLYNIIGVDAGYNHSLFLRADGTVWACGYNGYGQLGDGTFAAQRNTPVQVSGLSGIIQVSAGQEYSLFLKSDGTVWGTGGNVFEQLGLFTMGSVFTPVQSTWFTNVKAISAGYYHSLFLMKDGTVGSCGDDSNGQLGDGGIGTTIIAPHYVTSLSGITAIAAGSAISLFLKNDGTVWSCGANNSGALGDGTTADKNIPVQVSNLLGISAIDAGSAYSVCLRKDGTVWSFGANYYGQLGDGALVNQLSPVKAVNICKVAQPMDAVYPRYLLGSLYADADHNCNFQNTETAIPYQLVRAMPGNIFAMSNDTGFYSLGIYDSIHYIVEPVIPQRLSYMIKNPCPLNYQPYLDYSLPKDTGGFDFGFDYAPCHQLRVDVSANRKRRCLRNYTSVYYINEGLAAANGVEIHVKFASNDIPVLATIPYTIDPIDNSMVFNIGVLQPYQPGLITIVDSVACVAGITGLTLCTEAWILPPNQCLIDSTSGTNWNHASIEVAGNCINDTVNFVVKNMGTGNMTDSSEYRVYFNNVLTQTKSFKLNSGDSLLVKIV